MSSKKDGDPGWNYGTSVEGTKNTVRCNFCSFVSKAGITRHKHHLAWDSLDVAKCPKVPADVKNVCKEHFEKKKRSKEAMNSIPHFDEVVDLEQDDQDDGDKILGNRTEDKSKGKRLVSSTNDPNKKGKGTLYSMFKPLVTSGKKLRLDVVQKFAHWMYDAGLSFNAVHYESVGLAIEAIGRYGCGMKPPSYHEVRFPMLKLEMEHTKKILHDNKVEKSTYGCSLMADGWKDWKGRALINFLVNTSWGSMFIESVDVSSYSHTGENMFKLFDRFIQKVGPKDVIQILTDSASNNVATGKLVEQKYPHIYWTPCAAHCIDLILEDIFKLPDLKKLLKEQLR